VGSQRLQVGDLVGEGARLSLLERRRAPVTALVVENHRRFFAIVSQTSLQ